jgi:hypothetical protein
MGFEELLTKFDWSKLSFFVLFILPGFVSLQIWSLIVPTSDKPLKDSLPEALGFGVLNAVVGGPLVVLLAPKSPGAFYSLLVVTLVLLPAAWPFVAKWCLGKLAEYNLILNRNRNGWDAVFQRQEQLYVIVHLKDGRQIGGFFGPRSFAGLHPASGHLYLQQLWYLNEAGQFQEPIAESRGLILRPDDYHFIELFTGGDEADDERQRRSTARRTVQVGRQRQASTRRGRKKRR